MSLEGLRLKANKILIKLLKKRRNKEIKNPDFTIISNNCWGGMVYESLNLPKQSPTVGLFFMAEEYIKFLKKFPEVLNSKIVFINPSKSKYKDFLKKDSRFGNYPIGVIDGIEIEFLHYTSEKEVVDKWMRRCKRVNYDRIIVKFNDQNLCNQHLLDEFLQLKFKNKVYFYSGDISYNNSVCVRCSSNGPYVQTSQEPILDKKKYNVIKTINNL